MPMSSPIQNDNARRSSSCPLFKKQQASCPKIGEAAKELILNDKVEFCAVSSAPMIPHTPEIVRGVKKLAQAVGIAIYQSYIYVPQDGAKSLHAYVLTKKDPDLEFL